MKWLAKFLVAIVAAGGGAYGWSQLTNLYGVSLVQVEPKELSIKVGKQVTLEVNAKNGQGTYIRDVNISSWYSVNPDFASVSSDGLVTGHISGDTTIRADFRGYKIRVPVVVFSKATTASVPPDLKQSSIKPIRLPLDGAQVYIFTQKENHRLCADKLNGLIDKTHATVSVSSNMEGPDFSDIRYYSDKPTVEKSVEIIRNQLTILGIKATTKLTKKGGFIRQFQVSSDLIEVWFGKQDTCKIYRDRDGHR